MHRIAEEGGLLHAFQPVRHPAPAGSGSGIVDRVGAIGAEMADIFSGIRINNKDAAIAIAVGDIQAVGLGIHHHVGGQIEQGRAVDAAIGVIAGGRGGRAADAHLEIAVHVELQDKAVAAILVGGPAGGRIDRLGAIARDPDIVVLVDIDAMLAVGPDAAVGRLAMAFQPARIGRAAPGAQQLAVGVELQHRRRGIAAVGHGAIGARKAQPVLAVTAAAGFQRRFVGGHGARAVIDPDVIVMVDIEPADLAQHPAMRQRRGPAGIGDKARRRGGGGLVVDAGGGIKPVQDAD